MRTLSILGLLAVAGIAAAEEPIKLAPGTTAPKIEVGGWAKYGAPEAKPGRVRVVEFWATWCGPCKTTIPHLTELAKKYKDKVDFVGVSVWERGEDEEGQVRKFVTEWADKMDYRVAFDTKDDTMAKTWMTAAEQNGIPTAFIVNDKNQVLWIGHPMSIDKPLEQAVAGTFDVEAERKKFVAEITQQREQQKVGAEISEAVKLYKAGNTAEAETKLSAVAAKSPNWAKNVRVTRLTRLYTPGSPESDKLVGEFLAGSPEDLMMLGQFAYQQAANKPTDESKARARKLAEQLAAKKDAFALYFVGLTYNSLGDKAEAQRAFEGASAAADTDPRAKGNPAFLEAIKKQIEALKSGK